MALSELHEQVARAAARFAESELEARATAIDEGGARVDLAPLAAQGLLAPDLPVESGGAGADALARTLVLEALAHACASTALAAGVQGLAARLALRGGDAELARRLAAGEERAALAFSEGDSGEDDLDALATRSDAGSLMGEKHVLGAPGFDRLFVLARDGSGPVLAHVPATGLGVTEEPARVGLRGLSRARVMLAGAPVLAGAPGLLGGADLARHARDGARALVAPIAAGLASRALDEARRYAMLRQQFGRAIARFQGVQFLVAQILVAREGCRALARSLAAVEARGEELGSAHAAAAALEAPATAVRAALDAVQVFGGMGYTREVVVERLTRDALALQALAGSAGGGAELTLARELLGRRAAGSATPPTTPSSRA